MFSREAWEQEGREIRELVSRFERAVIENASAFFEDDDLEQIIEHYQDTDNLDRALLAADYALGLNPYNATFYIRKADVLFEQRRFDEAWDCTEQAAIYDPSEVEIFYLRADLHVQREEFPQALACLEEALLRADADEHDQILVEMAEVYGDLTEYERMFDCLRQALERNPTADEALQKLAFCLDMSGQYEAGIVLCQRLIDVNPYSFMAWHTLGKAYAGMHLFEKAMEAFAYVQAIDERFLPVYRDWGEAFFRLGRYREAMGAFLQAIDREDPQDTIFFRIGRCREYLGELSGARHHYRKALQADAFNDEALYRIGCTYLAENQVDQAMRHFQKAVDLSPENAEYRAALGRLFDQEDDHDHALVSYREALRLRPDYDKHWIAYAVLLSKTGDRDAAVAAAEDALVHCGDMPVLFYLHGACMLAAGRRREGARSLEQAMDLDAASHTVLFELFPDLVKDPMVLDLIDQYSR